MSGWRAFDLVEVLDRWVERNVAPERMIGRLELCMPMTATIHRSHLEHTAS